MGQWTNFPNGISLTTATGTVAGQLNATTGAFANLVTVGTVSASGAVIGASGSFSGTVSVPSGGFSGETVAFTVAGTSAAATTYVPVPFAGEVISCIVAVQASASSALSYTISKGSAGASISVASTGAFGSAGSTRSNVVTSLALTTADSIKFVSADAATVGGNNCTVIFART